jgi:hypothetical protein
VGDEIVEQGDVAAIGGVVLRARRQRVERARGAVILLFECRLIVDRVRARGRDHRGQSLIHGSHGVDERTQLLDVARLLPLLGLQDGDGRANADHREEGQSEKRSPQHSPDGWRHTLALRPSCKNGAVRLLNDCNYVTSSSF